MKSVIFHCPLSRVRRLYHNLGEFFGREESCRQWRITDFTYHADRKLIFEGSAILSAAGHRFIFTRHSASRANAFGIRNDIVVPFRTLCGHKTTMRV